MDGRRWVGRNRLGSHFEILYFDMFLMKFQGGKVEEGCFISGLFDFLFQVLKSLILLKSFHLCRLFLVGKSHTPDTL